MRLLIDTNLLLLYVAGRTNARIIDVHKRLQTFDRSDYKWLMHFAKRYDGLTMTPNVMTETLNLLAQIAEPFRSDLRRELQIVAHAATEIYVPSGTAMTYPEYNWLGLTDATILGAITDDIATLTTDLDLYRAAAARGYDAISYAQARYNA